MPSVLTQIPLPLEPVSGNASMGIMVIRSLQKDPFSQGFFPSRRFDPSLVPSRASTAALDSGAASKMVAAARLLARASRQGAAAVVASAARRRLCGVAAAAAQQPFASSRCSARVRFSAPSLWRVRILRSYCCFGLYQCLVRGDAHHRLLLYMRCLSFRTSSSYLLQFIARRRGPKFVLGIFLPG